MSGQTESKINQLLQRWPKNTAALYKWMSSMGISRQLADKYVKTGWLKRIGSGAYIRTGDSVDVFGAIYALQEHGKLPVHPAGKTALQLKGYSHFVPAGLKQNTLILFGSRGIKLPAWFRKYKWLTGLRYVSTGLFKEDCASGFSVHDTGNYKIAISSPERAILELCYDVPKHESYEELDYIMQGLNTLRPDVLMELLLCCGSIKAKRLFMHMAEKHAHAWVKEISLKKIGLGSGTRQLYKNGFYDSKYKIVVPRPEAGNE
jgi:hypothetical protein